MSRNAIGHAAEPKRDRRWAEMYVLAKRYYIEHGDLDVPSNYVTPEGSRLGQWINNQRLIREGKKRGVLTPERIHALDDIGMSWLDLGEERWNRNFRALRAYYDQHGDLDVPQTYVTSDGLKLGQFVKNLRFHKDTKYRRCLTPERLRMLDEMGMIWDLEEYRWQQGFAAARSYFAEHGDLRPTRRYTTPDGFSLGTWIMYQRRKHKAGELSEERIEKLDTIGMQWD